MNKLVRLGLLLLATCCPLLVSAQSAAVSPAMMAQFKKMPKAEQQRLMKQYGLKASDFNKSVTEQATKESSEESEQELEDSQDKKTQVEQEGKSKPERYGMKLFKRPQKFSLENVPVPDSYVIGPGDEFSISVFGKESFNESVQVERDGALNISDIGPVQVAGLDFSEAKQLIAERIKAKLLGVDVAISLAELRTIVVFIAGEVVNPGSYTVPSLSTVSSALTLSDGLSDIGSLRQIQIHRNGQLLQQFDVYDLLLNGDSTGDIALQQGDVILVKPVSGLVEVSGEVVRPAIYEVRPGETIGDLLDFAGGLKSTAFAKTAVLERVNAQNVRELINLDLTNQNSLQQPVKTGDLLRLGSTAERFQNEVVLAGAVVRPGKYAWQPGMRINSILKSLWTDLHATADLDYALVIRETAQDGQIDVLQFNLGQAVNEPGSADNLAIEARDQIIVFHYENKAYNRNKLNTELRKKAFESGWYDEDDFKNSRMPEKTDNSTGPTSALQIDNLADQAFNLLIERQKTTQLYAEKRFWKPEETWLMEEFETLLDSVYSDSEYIARTVHLRRSELLYNVLERLKTRKNADQGYRIVNISGEVKVPGEYPLAVGGKILHLLNAAGGVKGSAFLERAELMRSYIDGDTGDLKVKHVNINLNDVLAGREKELLHSRDTLNVFPVPNWNLERQVRLTGLVRFPGLYTVVPGEKISSVLKRAGGLQPDAFAEGVVFTRLQTRQRESEQIQKLSQQLRADIAARSLSPDSGTTSPSEAMMMIAEIEKVKPMGRLVVDLRAIEAGDISADFVAEHGDELFVPPMNTSISVVGEVQHPSSHRFREGLTYNDYLSLAGGPRKRADEDRLYIIRADGSVYVPNKSSWFSVNEMTLKPGDTIVVPLDTEFKDSISLWTQVTQIFYQSAVALAAINSF